MRPIHIICCLADGRFCRSEQDYGCNSKEAEKKNRVQTVCLRQCGMINAMPKGRKQGCLAG